MVEPKTRTPVWSVQYRLKKTGKVDKHVADEEEPGRERRERESVRERERGGGGKGRGREREREEIRKRVMNK